MKRSDSRPAASLSTLQLRAQLLAQTRAFFAARAVLEVDTPALVRHAVTDANLHSARVQLPGQRAELYLHTSPEYAMKRLLAAGSGDIYQLSHVFRGDESGRQHNAEFMLLEWYRCGWSMAQLMDELALLCQQLLALPDARSEQLSYADAFRHFLDADPLSAAEAALRALCTHHGLDAALATRCQRDELLDWLMGCVIGPQLGRERLCFLHRYPASQAALAKLDPFDPRVALRFELYYRGMELANGFEELSDANEQRARFQRDRAERTRRGLPVFEPDEALLAALTAGLPSAAGVAVGFDRVLMLRTGAAALSEVLSFPLERA